MKKKKFKSENLGIVITSIKVSENLKKTLKSIEKSSVKPSQIIIVLPQVEKNVKIKKISNLEIRYSKIKNQVYQRTLGISYLKKKIKILLQLDDKILLEKNCVKYLLEFWNYAGLDIKGVGLNPIGQIKPKASFFQKITHTNFDKQGVILSNGYALGWNEQKENLYTQWLNGGMTSWNLSKMKYLKKRKFPLIKWCVCEDVIISFLNYEYKSYVILAKAKAKILKVKKNKNLYTFFYEGFIHSKVVLSYILFFKKLSLYHFFYSSLLSSLFGLLKSLIVLDLKNFCRFLGRFFGSFFYFSKKRFIDFKI